MATQGGDKAALLAMINQAAGELGGKMGVSSSKASQHGNNLLMGSKVNAVVARDLVSNAHSRVGDMNDFIREQSAADFEQNKTLLNNRQVMDSESRQQEDLRSVRSEYDYGSKKKFLDVLGNVSNATKLNRMRAQHEIEKAGAQGGMKSLKSSKMSRISYQSKLSRASRAPQAAAAGETIPEEVGPSEEDDGLLALPDDFVQCNSCLRPLMDDEKIINARFVNEAMAACRDISMFPICIACNFENLEQKDRELKRNSKHGGMKEQKETKAVFFPSNKKLYDANMHNNSEEFKQLGTMHMMNRNSDYFPLEKPQPVAMKKSPIEQIKMERMMMAGSVISDRNGTQRAKSFDMGAGGDIDMNRSIYIKSLIADRTKEEEIRNKIVTEQIVAMKRQGPRASSAARRHADTLFPTTTNQETHNFDVHAPNPSVDRTNFKKKNWFSSYVNSMFNAGVFVNPFQDGC